MLSVSVMSSMTFCKGAEGCFAVAAEAAMGRSFRAHLCADPDGKLRPPSHVAVAAHSALFKALLYAS